MATSTLDIKPPSPRQRRRRGRVEQATEAAVRAARQGEPADLRFAACEALARQVAAGLDVAQGDPYALSQLAPRLLELLRELRLTPSAAAEKQRGPDPIMELLRDLATPTMGN